MKIWSAPILLATVWIGMSMYSLPVHVPYDSENPLFKFGFGLSYE